MSVERFILKEFLENLFGKNLLEFFFNKQCKSTDFFFGNPSISTNALRSYDSFFFVLVDHIQKFVQQPFQINKSNFYNKHVP
jgi:hypothetical protein